eukprot:10977161-Alexandrium_andersonii.AAC.1
MAYSAEQPPRSLSRSQGATGVRRERQKANLPQKLYRPLVARRAEGAEKVTRVTKGAPRQRHCRAPHKEVFRRTLANATQRTRPKCRRA